MLTLPPRIGALRNGAGWDFNNTVVCPSVRLIQSLLLRNAAGRLFFARLFFYYQFKKLNKDEEKKYEKPTMQVVELQQQAHLLAGSSQAEVNATMSGTWTEEDI